MRAQALSIHVVVLPPCYKALRFLFGVAVLAFGSILPRSSQAQASYPEFTNILYQLSSAKGAAEVDKVWSSLVSSAKIPLVAHDSVAFLYRGPARSVSWIGDFNGWGQSKTFAAKPIRIKETDIWILKASLPPDARVDYKILINDNEQILDPYNPLNQWSGVGGGSLNSELRMPEWKEDQATLKPEQGTPRGNVARDLVFSSAELGYQITYSVYTPPGWHQHGIYPVVYVTDGYEYMHERMGNMLAILDNLIYAGKIEPVMAVFIDHRQPVDRTNNRRMAELATNNKFSGFLIKELIPHVERNRGGEGGVRRGIVGTSIGGLTATWLSFTNPDIFHVAGAQSPAFWFKSDIYSLCERSAKKPERIFLSTGLIHDAEESVKKLKAVLEQIHCNYEYKEVNQGHSWGNWRDLIDDMLIYLFPLRGSQSSPAESR